MIEVEKKFQPTDEQLAQLLKDTEFISEKENVDIYYDLPDFSYFKKGMRLRKRNAAYELKIQIPRTEKNVTEHYEEVESEPEILGKLGYDGNERLEKIIEEQMDVLCSLKTKRKKYKKDEFIIDIDYTDFGYNVVEIELQVEKESEIPKAEEKITNLARAFGLSIESLPGKVALCLERTRPEVYKELYT